MRTIIASLITAGLLLVFFFQTNKDIQTELLSSGTQVEAQTSPTPPKNKAKKTKPEPSPPLPMVNPDYDEPSMDHRLNGALGSPDIDCDGVKNIQDSCIFTYNPNQKDRNKNGVGDVCEPDPRAQEVFFLRCDMDSDGVPDNKDNCPAVCNPDQKMIDINKNNINDICDHELPNSVTSLLQVCAKPIKVKIPKLPRPTKITYNGEPKQSIANNSNR